MLSIIGIAVAVYLFMMFMGWGASLLILPSALRPYQFWLAPWMGLIVVDISSVWLSRIGLGTEKSVYILFWIGIGFLGWCKYRKVNLSPQFRFIDIFIAGAALIALMLALYPLIVVDGFPTTISLGNNDPQLYALLGDYLKTHTIYQKPLLQADRPNSYLITAMLSARPGTWQLYSIISSLLRLQTHEIFTISIGVFFALTPPLIGIFTQLANGNFFSILFALVISALNINLLYFNYNGFGAQVPAQGCLILAFLILHSVDFNANRFRKYIISLSICLSALSTLYVELIPFFALPSFLYCSLLLLRQSSRKLQLAKKMSVLLLCIVFTTILIDPLAIYEGFQWLMAVSNVDAGWPMLRWALPADMVGLFSVYTLGSYSDYLPYIVSFPVSVIIVATAFRLEKKELWLSLLIFTAAILVWLGLFRRFSYGYHKAVAFLDFFIIITFSIGLGKILEITIENYLKKRTLSLIAQITFLGILSTSMWSATFPTFMIMSSPNHPSVDLSLSQLADLPIDDRKIYIDRMDVWKQMWATKFLGDRSMAFLSTSPYYGHDMFVSKTTHPDSLLLTPSLKKLIRNVNGADTKVVWKNDNFILKETADATQLEVSLGENWYSVAESWIKEAGSDQFYWLNQDATLKISRKSSSWAQVKLRIQFVPILPETTVDMYLNNRLLRTVKVSAVEYHDFDIQLDDQNDVLRIHVQEGSIMPPNDPREISIGVNSILVMKVD